MTMAFPDHFSAVAEKYAAYRPHYPPALAELLASLTAPGVAWDIGCGNGQLAVLLGAQFAHVIATDPSAKQIAAAVAHPRVEYRVEPAEASTLGDASVDLAVAAQAAHWFDWPRFVAEVGRVTRPGGLVALVSYGVMVIASRDSLPASSAAEGRRGPIDAEAGAELRHYYRDVAGPHWPPERAHVENGYRDLVLPWPAVAAPPLDMSAEWTRDELVGYVSTWSATARLVERDGSTPFETLMSRLEAVWPANEKRVVRWPLTLRLARR
jgi:SAM-dependent methyltransferase